MKSDSLRLLFTYSIAAAVIGAGLYIIYQTRLDPPEADVQGMRLLLAGFIGSALTFVFGRESASSSAFQSERAYAAGAALPTIPSVPLTVTSAPATSTVTTTNPPDTTVTTTTTGAAEEEGIG